MKWSWGWDRPLLIAATDKCRLEGGESEGNARRTAAIAQRLLSSGWEGLNVCPLHPSVRFVREADDLSAGRDSIKTVSQSHDNCSCGQVRGRTANCTFN